MSEFYWLNLLSAFLEMNTAWRTKVPHLQALLYSVIKMTVFVISCSNARTLFNFDGNRFAQIKIMKFTVRVQKKNQECNMVYLKRR